MKRIKIKIHYTFSSSGNMTRKQSLKMLAQLGDISACPFKCSHGVFVPWPIRRPMVCDHGRSEGRKSRGLLPVSQRIARSESAPTQCDC